MADTRLEYEWQAAAEQTQTGTNATKQLFAGLNLITLHDCKLQLKRVIIKVNS